MKKNWLRNSLSLLLTGVILLSALPVGAAGSGMDDETTQFPAGEQPPIVIDPSDDETPIIPVNPGASASKVLYSWTASDLNRDVNVFSSNLADDFDPNQRWNESATITFEDHYGEPHEVVVPGTDFSVNGSCKVINVSEIVAADGRQLVTCTIRNGDEVVASVTDSLESSLSKKPRR